MIKKNLREWEECLPHVEFAYNRAVHSTTQLCPFEVVYGFKPLTPLDLLPLPLHERIDMEASKRADYVRKIHERTREAIAGGKTGTCRVSRTRLLPSSDSRVSGRRVRRKLYSHSARRGPFFRPAIARRSFGIFAATRWV